MTSPSCFVLYLRNLHETFSVSDFFPPQGGVLALQ